MSRTEKLAELKALDKNAEAIRDELAINAPGCVIFMGCMAVTSDEILVVEADGYGGATVSVVEGNYPVDYITKFENVFPSEDQANDAAEKMAEKPLKYRHESLT